MSLIFVFQRNFQLHLRPKQLPLDKDFKVIEIDGQNNQKTADVFNDIVLYEGYVIG